MIRKASGEDSLGRKLSTDDKAIKERLACVGPLDSDVDYPGTSVV